MHTDARACSREPSLSSAWAALGAPVAGDDMESTRVTSNKIWMRSPASDGGTRASTFEDSVKSVRVALTLLGLLVATPVVAQAPSALAEAPSFTPAQLNELVAPVALYPDTLLAQVLAAATFHDELPAAAQWVDQHRDLKDVKLAAAMHDLRGNPTVEAILPFPEVLHRMVSDADWTRKLGDAFLAQQPAVLQAVQADRVKAKEFGYLTSKPHTAVESPSYVAIIPTDPAEIFVPSYDPAVVFSSPPPGADVANAIGFEQHVSVGGFRLAYWNFGNYQVIGGYFQAWGWGLEGIDWPAQKVIINGAAWQRNWANRGEYVQRYQLLERVPAAQ
jgi:hypothetical protein